MARSSWTASFALCASAIALVAVRGDQRAGACGFFAEPIEDSLTFDTSSWRPAAPRADCLGECMMLADWHDYFRATERDDAEWRVTLLQVPADKLDKLAKTVHGARLRDALAYVALARRLEPSATLLRQDDKGIAIRPPSSDLVALFKNGAKSAKDPFLAQRYAYQVVRALFYQRDWRAAIAYFDQNAAALAQPSAWLAAHARWYVAGALKRAGSRARASLEIARIHAAGGELADEVLVDFQPLEQSDWQQSLALAKDVREKTLLWALVGDKQRDGLAAARQIAGLDPKSDLLGELIVDALASAERIVSPSEDKPSAMNLAARDKAYAEIEALATKLLATPGVDRPWLLELVVGHLDAKRGNLAGARAHLGKALAHRGGDPKVASQARASLALAIARGWQIDPAHEDELAKDVAAIDAKFGPLPAVKANVRIVLAKAYAKAGRMIEAEFLRPGTVDKWNQAAFIKDMIARAQKSASAWDHFVLDGALDRKRLQQELAFRDVLDGDFAAAQKAFPGDSAKLGTDPFVIHIVDCHDCDHEKYANAPWTVASFLAKLVVLAQQAGGSGEPAAEAALALGNALYNVTWSGNARVVFEGTNQETRDTGPALRWYKRAHDLSRNRELKARAAFYAAKAELAQVLAKDSADAVAVPKTWYPIVKTYADTKYYKEILRECGWYRDWAARSR